MTPAFGLKWIGDGGVVVLMGFIALRIRGSNGVIKYCKSRQVGRMFWLKHDKRMPRRFLWRTYHRPWYFEAKDRKA